MTIIKSLKYRQNKDGVETINRHRTHRSPKNRKVVYGLANIKAFKQKVRELTEEELSEEVDKLLKV